MTKAVGGGAEKTIGLAPAAPHSHPRDVEGERMERGAAIIEYMFLLSLVVVVAIGSLVYVGATTQHLLNNSVTVIRHNVP